MARLGYCCGLITPRVDLIKTRLGIHRLGRLGLVAPLPRLSSWDITGFMVGIKKLFEVTEGPQRLTTGLHLIADWLRRFPPTT